MNKSADLISVFAFNGQNVSVAAHGNNVFLKILIVSVPYKRKEFLSYLLVKSFYVFSECGEFFGRVIAHRIFAEYFFSDFVLQIQIDVNARNLLFDIRSFRFRIHDGRIQYSAAFQKPRNAQQFAHGQSRALFHSVRNITRIVVKFYGTCSVVIQKIIRFARFIEQKPRVRKIAARDVILHFCF